jgi:hypothetical protein
MPIIIIIIIIIIMVRVTLHDPFSGLRLGLPAAPRLPPLLLSVDIILIAMVTIPPDR